LDHIDWTRCVYDVDEMSANTMADERLATLARFPALIASALAVVIQHCFGDQQGGET
jgi:hypothetical protein